MKRLMNIYFGSPRFHFLAVAFPRFGALLIKASSITGDRLASSDYDRSITNTLIINDV